MASEVNSEIEKLLGDWSLIIVRGKRYKREIEFLVKFRIDPEKQNYFLYAWDRPVFAKQRQRWKSLSKEGLLRQVEHFKRISKKFKKIKDLKQATNEDYKTDLEKANKRKKKAAEKYKARVAAELIAKEERQRKQKGLEFEEKHRREQQRILTEKNRVKDNLLSWLNN